MDIFNVLDIGIITIMLFFILSGLARGFLNSLIKLFGSLVSLAIAIWLAQPVASFIDGVTNISTWFAGKIETTLVSLDQAFFDSTTSTEMTGAQLETELEGVEGLSSVVLGALKLFISPDETIEAGTHVGSWFGEVLGAVATLVFATILIFVGIKIVVIILSKVFDAVTSSKAIGGLDRLLGLAFGAAKGGVVISLAFAALSLVVFVPGGESLITSLVDGSSIGQQWYILVHEQITNLIEVINFNDIIYNAYTS